jgi:hypothetical protein
MDLRGSSARRVGRELGAVSQERVRTHTALMRYRHHGGPIRRGPEGRFILKASKTLIIHSN